MKIWSWRHAIQKADLPSTTKLVLFNLSVHMNDAGESCYPSTGKQAQDTGLSERSVCTHLDKAADAGFIEKKRHGYGGQKWARNEYFATYPKGTEPDAKALNLFPKGTEPDDKKALNDVQSNSSEELSSSNIKEDTNVSSKKSYPDDFEYWWSIFPRQRRGSKTKAFTAWKSVTKENNPEDIINGTEQYATSDEVKRGYAKGATAWLNDHRWTVNYRPAESKLQKSSDLAMDIVNRFNDNPWE